MKQYTVTIQQHTFNGEFHVYVDIFSHKFFIKSFGEYDIAHRYKKKCVEYFDIIDCTDKQTVADALNMLWTYDYENGEKL